MAKKIKPEPQLEKSASEIPVDAGDRQLIAEAFAKVQELQFQLGAARLSWLRQENNAVQQIVSAESNTSTVLKAVADKYKIDGNDGQKWQFVLDKSAFVRG